MEDGNAIVAFQTKNANKNIRYNAEKTAFTCYSTQGDNIRIYAKNKGTDGINRLAKDSKSSAKGVFTITGQRVDGKPLSKGLYIVDGKKVVVR